VLLILNLSVISVKKFTVKEEYNLLEEELDVYHSRGNLLHNISDEVKLIPWAVQIRTYTSRKNHSRQ